MDQIYLRFLRRLTESHEPDAFQRAMVEAAQAFDLSCFAYLRMPRDGKSLAALISNYPLAWTDHYLARHFEKIDPVIRRALTSTAPFAWGFGVDAFALGPIEQEFFDAARTFDIGCGFTFPIHDNHGPVAAVTFASDLPRAAFLRSIELNRVVLHCLSMSLHSEVLLKLWPDPIINNIRLSPREYECLRLAADGKSAEETATLLNLSKHTVRFHIDNAVEKLGVANKRRAIEAFVRAQLRK